MTLTTFVRTYLGKKVDFDNTNGCQCVDLFRQYVKDVYGMEQTPALGENGGAKDIFDKHGSLCVTPDTLLTDYSKGDVLVWGPSETNKYGHVAILVDVYNTKYFIVLEQDGFKQDGVKLAFRSREGLLGCLWKRKEYE